MRRRCLTWLVCFALGFLTCPVARGLDPETGIRQYARSTWSLAEGLPQSSVHAMVEDQAGYLWLATQEGLVRFDGFRFEVYDKTSVPALESNLFRCLHSAPDGTIWAGTTAGLLRIRGDDFRLLTTHDGLVGNSIAAVVGDSRGDLWIATERGGLSRWRDGEVEALTAEHGLASDEVRALALGSDGALWIGTRGGLSVLRDGRLRTFGAADGLAHDEVRALHVGADGAVWVGTGGGLSRLVDGVPGGLPAGHPLAGQVVDSLWEDRDGSLWVGLNSGGLWRLAGGRAEGFREADGLASDLIRALYEDREGGLWIGTAGGGVTHLRDGVFATYSTRDGLPSDRVYTVFEDRRGTLWAGTFGGGLGRDDGSGWVAAGERLGLPSQNVWSFAEDSRGGLWIGTYGEGLYRLRDGRAEAVPLAGGVEARFVRTILEGPGGTLWVGTRRGLHRIVDGRETVYTRADGLLSDRIYCLYLDRGRDLWIGTEHGGLSRWAAGRFVNLTTEDGLSSDLVYSLHEDAEGALWIGTAGGGLNRYRHGRFDVVSSREGLFDDTIYSLLEDAEGNLWMSCNKGVFRVRKEQLEAFFSGHADRVHSVAYDERDGLLSREANGGSQPAAIKGRDGRLWFPTLGGVSVVDPKRAVAAQTPPRVEIESVLVDGLPAAADDDIRVAPGADRLEIHFAVLSLGAAAKARFAYRLEGFDDDWVEVGARRAAYYTRTPPGRYRFVVRARHEDGLWSPVPQAEITLDVEPRFHQTPLFVLLAASALTLCAAGLYHLRIRQLRRRERELAERVDAALDQIRVLEGMLPICASCKRIRDEERGWSELEAYISEHSQAEFSHGLCPDCAAELYPDLIGGESAPRAQRGGPS